MKCIDCVMLDSLEGCYANPGEDCDQIEQEMGEEVSEETIEYFSIDHSNEYAAIIDPEEHEDERTRLMSEGYQPHSRYKTQLGEDKGKTEELWVRYNT